MSSYIVEIKDLVYEYPDFRALHHINLTINRGTVTALVGPNGAGKTTLMRCIAALTIPLSGSIWVDEINTVENPREIHKRIGYLSDFYGLYDHLTVYQSLLFMAYAKDIPDEEVENRIQWITHLLDMKELLFKKCKEMSRGQRQKTAIAMTVIHKPQLVLLDEPASGLDPIARTQLSEMIKNLAKEGITFLVSSHILTELQDYSNHLIIIDKGRIVENKPLLAAAYMHGKRFQFKLSNEIPPHMVYEKLSQISNIDHQSFNYEDGIFYFTHTGTEDEQKHLLMQLIQLQLPISELSEAQLNLQSEYLKSLKKD